MTTGVRQGCLLSPLLFLVVLDWVTKTAYASSGKGIQWTFTKKLEDLEFADDLALLVHRFKDMQKKVKALKGAAEKNALKINREKKSPQNKQSKGSINPFSSKSCRGCSRVCLPGQQDQSDRRHG